MAEAGCRRCAGRVLVDRQDGMTDDVWTDARTGASCRRVGALPGFGKQKSQIFTARCSASSTACEPPGWREAAGQSGAEGTYGRSRTSATPHPC